MTIWLIVGLMAVVAVAALLWPLLKAPKPAQDRAAYDMTVFQDQLKEVERDVERGVLTTAEADAARLEIQRRILAASRAPAETHTADSSGRRRTLAAAVAVSVPVLAVALYTYVGSPQLTAPGAVVASNTSDDAEINSMVAQLADKVAANPTDVEGVTLLARTYRQLGRFSDAVGIYQKLIVLQPSADAYSSLGEVITAANDGKVTKEAHDALIKALSLDRGEPRARFYLGLEKAEQGDARAAIAIWRHLTADAPPDAPWLTMVREQMAGVAQQANIPPMTIEPKHPLDYVPTEEMALARMQAAAPPTAPTPAPGPPPTGSLQGRVSPENMEMIKGMVEGLAAKLEANPSDYNGWLMLGRSYAVLGNQEGARKAYEKAIALKPTEVEPKLQFLAFIMTVVDPNTLMPLPKILTTTAADILKIDPNQPEALFITGLDRAKSGDDAAAKDIWKKVLAQPGLNPGLKSEIDRRMQSLN